MSDHLDALALEHAALGWRPIWIRRDAEGKRVPLTGSTGYAGIDMPRAPDAITLATGCPDGAVMVDVDQYGSKTGADTLRELEAELGPLPPTCKITSRGPDDPGGKLLFQVPPGTRLKGKAGASIEFVQRHHRWTWAPGTTHPKTDTEVTVYGPDGAPCDLPAVASLPAMPGAWLEYHRADDRAGERVPVEIPDDGETVCRAAAAWLDRQDFTGAEPRGQRASDAATYLKRKAAEGHYVAPVIEAARAALTETEDPDWDSMWGDITVTQDYPDADLTCCGRGLFGIMPRALEVPAMMTPGLAGTATAATVPDSLGQPGTVPDELAGIAARYAPVDWEQAWKAQPDDIDWLREPVLERGTVNALFAKPGTGKSLLAEEISLGLARAGEVVVYVDDENRLADLVERFQSMGAEPEDLANLRLYSFASLPALDTPEGGWHLLALAVTNRATLVVLDTTTRLVAGRENDSDTFLQLYRCSLVPLKRQGVTVLRLDHPGKDEDRGQRGSSAKDGDVDTIWRMTEVIPERLYRLERTKSRSGHGEPVVNLERLTLPLRHAWGGSQVHKLSPLAVRMNALNIPVDAGRPAVLAALRTAGVKVGNAKVSEAIRERRQLSGTARDSCPEDTRGDSAESCPAVPPYTGDRGQFAGAGPERENNPASGEPDPPGAPGLSPDRQDLLARLIERAGADQAARG